MGRRIESAPQPEQRKVRRFGAYRKIGYQDDGVTKYACMDCKNVFNFADDPAYYNFCPKCGMSWFKGFECREHWVPRWYYDRYGNNGDARMYPDRHEHPRCWLVQTRSRHRWKMPDKATGKYRWAAWDDFTTWDTKHRLRYFLGSWRDALRYLNMIKRDYYNTSSVQYQHRIIIGAWK